MQISSSTVDKVLCSRPIRTCVSKKSGPIIRCSGKGFGTKVARKKEKKKKVQKSESESISDPQPLLPRDATSQSTSLNGQQRPQPGEFEEVPEVINQRLLNRMITFSLVPVLLGFVSLPLLAYVQVGLKVDLPTGTAFTVSGLFFGAGVLGITYGIFSASWDENVEGTGLGLKEFKTNTAPFVEKVKDKLK